MAPSRWLYIAFQSTHPRRVRRDGGDRYYDSSDVSIHAPTQGATNGFSGHLASSLSFNPRTHAGCDFLVRLEHRAARVVSIHAPTQGATGHEHERDHGHHPVSIHAPTQGATSAGRSACPAVRCFNPRTHAGCDACSRPSRPADIRFQSTHPRRVRRCGLPGSDQRGGVSIHAPTQGATRSRRNIGAKNRFQSTHPRRVRHGLGRPAVQPVQGFNPRTHAGCDVADDGMGTHLLGVSIHAPTQGATASS